MRGVILKLISAETTIYMVSFKGEFPPPSSTFFREFINNKYSIMLHAFQHTLGITPQARVIAPIFINWIQIGILRGFPVPNTQDYFYFIFCKLIGRGEGSMEILIS